MSADDETPPPGATRPDIPAAKVCEHFYASHCYRGMSVRLCMLCHEPDWDDLAGQLAASPAPAPPVPSATATEPAEGVREALGRLVRETWVKWAAEQPDPKPSWLTGWDELDDGQREVDMRIGHAVANFALTENAVTWGTSCLSCARVLDRSMAEHERAEAAEARLAEVRGVLLEGGQGDATARCRAIAITGTGEAAGPKLVRDKIPALIRAQGLNPVTRTASAGEMPTLLRAKLREETGEYLASGDPAELADVLEVLYALAGLAGVSAGGLERLRAVKAEERGTFAGGVVWAGNREPGTGEEPLSAACTGCGEEFADSETGEYLFAARDRMERLLHADGWQASPVLCPACQQEPAP